MAGVIPITAMVIAMATHTMDGVILIMDGVIRGMAGAILATDIQVMVIVTAMLQLLHIPIIITEAEEDRLTEEAIPATGLPPTATLEIVLPTETVLLGETAYTIIPTTETVQMM